MTLAFWYVLIAAFLPYATLAFAKWSRDYDNRDPRAWLATQGGLRRRADYAHRNHLEAFPFFAAAVLIGAFTHVAQVWLDRVALAFIALRIAYTLAYLADRPSLRSLVWTAAYGCCVALFVMAGLSG